MGQAQTRIRTDSPGHGGRASSDQIKSNIDHTRHEMDETINELSERLRPRHLIDEVICMIQESGSNAGDTARDVGRSAARQIRDHPVPAALIGAGIAWMLMGGRRDGPSRFRTRERYPDRYAGGITALDYPAGRGTDTVGIYERDEDFVDEAIRYQTEEPYYHYDAGTAERARQAGRRAKSRAEDTVERARAGAEDTADRVRRRAEEAAQRTRDKALSAAERAQIRAQQAGETASSRAGRARAAAQQAAASTAESVRYGAARTGEALSHAAHRARDQAVHLGETVQDRASKTASEIAHEARRGYEYSRESFVEAKEKHPVALASGFLALGILAGLAMPHSRREDRWIGPTSDSVKERAREAGRDLAERGAHVASSTASAARREAREQGLTPHELKEGAKHAAEDTVNAALDSANREGVTPYDLREKAEHVGHDTREALREAAKKEGLTGEQLKDRASKVAEEAKETAKNEAQKNKEGAKEDVQSRTEAARQDVRHER